MKNSESERPPTAHTDHESADDEEALDAHPAELQHTDQRIPEEIAGVRDAPHAVVAGHQVIEHDRQCGQETQQVEHVEAVGPTTGRPANGAEPLRRPLCAVLHRRCRVVGRHQRTMTVLGRHAHVSPPSRRRVAHYTETSSRIPAAFDHHKAEG
jgi:hypothetical protein